MILRTTGEKYKIIFGKIWVISKNNIFAGLIFGENSDAPLDEELLFCKVCPSNCALYLSHTYYLILRLCSRSNNVFDISLSPTNILHCSNYS